MVFKFLPFFGPGHLVGDPVVYHQKEWWIIFFFIIIWNWVKKAFWFSTGDMFCSDLYFSSLLFGLDTYTQEIDQSTTREKWFQWCSFGKVTGQHSTNSLKGLYGTNHLWFPNCALSYLLTVSLMIHVYLSSSYQWLGHPEGDPTVYDQKEWFQWRCPWETPRQHATSQVQSDGFPGS